MILGTTLRGRATRLKHAAWRLLKVGRPLRSRARNHRNRLGSRSRSMTSTWTDCPGMCSSGRRVGPGRYRFWETRGTCCLRRIHRMVGMESETAWYRRRKSRSRGTPYWRSCRTRKPALRCAAGAKRTHPENRQVRLMLRLICSWCCSTRRRAVARWVRSRSPIARLVPELLSPAPMRGSTLSGQYPNS